MAGRNSNGEGTLYRRKDGRWEGAIYLLTTAGTRKKFSVYGRTRAEAHHKVLDAKARERQGLAASDKVWTVGEYLDYWLEEIVQPTKRPKTYEQYELIVRLHLKPALGKCQLKRLTVHVVQEFFNQQLKSGKSIRRVQMMRTTLSALLTHAMRAELLSRNVARLTVLPTYTPGEITPWTLEEARRFLTAASSHYLYPAFLVLLFYGLRRGEVLGLRWRDVDLDNGEMHIRQQLQRVGRELIQGPVKTNAGRRDLPLLPLVGQALRVHKANRQAGTTGSDDLVFTTSVGTPLEPRNFVRTFWQLCDQAKVSTIKLHHVRHTAATLLKDLGVQPRDTQLILGHSHVSVTQQIYQHGDMTSRREALGRMERVLLSAEPDAGDTDEDSQAEPGCLDRVGNGQRCRQFSRQGTYWSDLLAWLTTGGPGEFRTLDTLLKRPIQPTPEGRITEVRAIARRRTTQLILGIVAVNVAVKSKLSTG